MKKLPVYECKVRDRDNTGIYAISFVEMPAVEVNFVALSKQIPVKLKLDGQKQILTGAVLIPNQKIYRNDANLGEYYMYYSAPEIEKIAQKMMRTGVALQTTTHQHEKPLKGNYLVECWLVEDPKRDKAVALGLGELPKGTLVASYKVTNSNYWKSQVMTGKVKGFSLEGFFNFQNSNRMAKQTKTVAQILAATDSKKSEQKGNKVATFLRSFAAMLDGDTASEADALATEAANDATDSGTPYLIFELADGGEVYVDSEGYATLNGEQMPAGEHALTDGNFIVIDDSGYLVVTQADNTTTSDPAAPDAAALAAAKERAKNPTALAAFTKKPAPNTAEAKIAALKAQIAELEKTPTTEKKVPTALMVDDMKNMTHAQKMAKVIADRRERASRKKAE